MTISFNMIVHMFMYVYLLFILRFRTNAEDSNGTEKIINWNANGKFAQKF